MYPQSKGLLPCRAEHQAVDGPGWRPASRCSSGVGDDAVSELPGTWRDSVVAALQLPLLHWSREPWCLRGGISKIPKIAMNNRKTRTGFWFFKEHKRLQDQYSFSHNDTLSSPAGSERRF